VTGNPVSDVGGMGAGEMEGAKRTIVKMMRESAGERGVLMGQYRLLVWFAMRRA
jgi:hypothetical protein